MKQLLMKQSASISIFWDILEVQEKKKDWSNYKIDKKLK